MIRRFAAIPLIGEGANRSRALYKMCPAERRILMGEIILSIAIGGCLVVAGVIMNVYLSKEEKKVCGDK